MCAHLPVSPIHFAPERLSIKRRREMTLVIDKKAVSFRRQRHRCRKLKIESAMRDLSGRRQGAINADRLTFHRSGGSARLARGLANRLGNFQSASFEKVPNSGDHM